MRIDIIKNKLKAIEENIDLVKENIPEEIEEFIELGLIKDGIYKKIEASIQYVIYICSIINSDLNLGIPSNRDEIINALVKKKIISKDMGKKVKELKGFRNFLIHRYGKIQDEIAFEDIKKGIIDFKDFKNEILQFLNTIKEKEKDKNKT